jgi:hypothetical protein
MQDKQTGLGNFDGQKELAFTINQKDSLASSHNTLKTQLDLESKNSQSSSLIAISITSIFRDCK